jgi:hypothetical protein
MVIPVDAHFITLLVTTHEIVTRQIQVGRTTHPGGSASIVRRKSPPRGATSASARTSPA